jgi:hypothetical protein
MKKIIFLMLVIAILSGCARAANVVPDGKTYDANWEADEKYCLEKSGKVTGFWAANPFAIGWNANANKKYNDCLRELGWLK